MTIRFLSLSVSILFLIFCCVGCKKENNFPKQSVLKISTETEPQTLDPRLVRNLQTATVIQALYEGLTRLDLNGQPQPALAESIEISSDQKTYTFKLRPSAWSNGNLVTAQDFEQTWKSVLDPQFPAPNAYQFYSIKGAKEAKLGQLPIDQVGIKAINDSTLVVELEQPTPYFLDLTAAYFFYPVHTTLRKNSETSTTNYASLLTNGPFKVLKYQNELIADKNPYYWDKNNVQLDKIILVIVDNPTALQMFGRNELNWTGSPMSTIPTDAISTLKSKIDFRTKPGAGTQLVRLNTNQEPFNNVKIRQAFNLALNRKDLIEHVLKGNQTPALKFIPPSLLPNDSLYEDHNIAAAQALFKEALAELNVNQKTFEPITLCYVTGERNHKIAQVLQQQWKTVLGIEVQLQSCEAKVHFDLLKNRQYQASIGSWFADIKDPTSFLDVFKFKDNGTNNTEWENVDYIHLLELASQTTDSNERKKFLQKVENILIAEMPIIPIFHSSYNYIKDEDLKGVYFSELGYLDFKNAYFEVDEET